MPVDDYVFDEIEEFPSPLGDYFFNLTLKGMKSLSTKQDLSFRPHQGDYFFNYLTKCNLYTHRAEVSAPIRGLFF